MKRLLSIVLIIALFSNLTPVIAAKGENVVATNYIQYGDAKNVYDNVYELTALETYRSGSIWIDEMIDTRANFVVSFSYCAGGGRDKELGGADGIVLTFSENMGLGAYGEYLGFVNGNTYGVELDSYSGNTNDPEGKHIAVIHEQTFNHLASVLDDRVDDSQWHEIEVVYVDNTFAISLDGKEVLRCNNIYLPDKVYLGLSASTATGQNQHLVSELKWNYLLEYVYDAADPAEDMTLPTENLDSVSNTATATSAINTLTSGMTAAQKTSAVGADLATLYAETAVSKAASKEVSSNEIIINAAAVKELEATAASTAQAVETALVNGGVSTGRYIANTVTLTTEQTGKITIKVDPDILTTKVDKIRVETPKYALTLKVSDLKADLSSIVTISAESMDVSESGSYALGGTAGSTSMRTVVALDLPGGHTTNSVTLSFPSANSSGANEAVVNESGAASSSKYNPATVTMDGKVNTSGKYTVKSNEKDFTDIANKSAEMQNAIRYLASKGIINGTSETTFSPDGSISRAEIAALIVRALGKLDSTATASFTDVTTADWYYSAAASSQKNGIINGYSDNTFKGKNPIIKQEIVAVAARVLKNEMNYKEPANTQTYLAKYSDTVAGWAQPEVALATRENLIVYRVDGTFSGAKNMTRGDAAIIIYRLFQHIW